MKTTTTGIRMPLEMRKRIEDEAKKLNTTLTGCCRGLIDDGFEHRYKCKNHNNPDDNPDVTKALTQEIAVLKSKLKERDNTSKHKAIATTNSKNGATCSTGFHDANPGHSSGNGLAFLIILTMLGLIIAPSAIAWFKRMPRG